MISSPRLSLSLSRGHGAREKSARDKRAKEKEKEISSSCVPVRGIVPQLTKLLLSRGINAINRCILHRERERRGVTFEVGPERCRNDASRGSAASSRDIVISIQKRPAA